MPIYRLLLSLITCLAIPALLIRVLRGQETWTDLAERLSFKTARATSAPLWIHGASNGELTAAKSLVTALRAKWPDTPVHITCNTTSAKRMVTDWKMNAVTVTLAPLDLWGMQSRFLNHLNPRALLLLEGDFWPNRMLMTAKRSIPILLISARMSQSSANMWARFPSIARRVMQTPTLAWPQDEASRERLGTLGLAAQKTAQVLELKSDYTASPMRVSLPFARQSTWLAASTHEGEDDTILTAHAQLRNCMPDMRLILAPRHPKRAKSIATLAAGHGLRTHLWSENRTIPDETDVLIADTLGEMAQWYNAAPTCFVGGSLVPKGGHTPFEPIAHACTVLTGPHRENFADIYNRLLAADAAKEITDSTSLSETLLSLVSKTPDPDSLKRAQETALTFQTEKNAAANLLNAMEKLVFDGD